MLFLGIDIGTTGTKSILVDERGFIIKRAYRGYGITSPMPGWVEQNPLDWWEAVKFTIKECLKEEQLKESLCALAISAQGGSMALLDQSGAFLGDAISWMDTRAKVGRQTFIDDKGAEYYHKRTGFMLNTGLAMQNIRWLKTYDPERFAKVSAIYTTLDYINFRLTGQAVIDPSGASLMQLLNIRQKCWDEEILELIGLDQSKLALIKPAGSLVGNLTASAATELGLPERLKVYNGGLDQSCMALGSGNINEGDVVLSTGTAWAMLAVTNKPDIISGLRFSVIPHVIEDKWCFLSTIPSAGASLDWLREKLFSMGETESYKDMDSKIAECEPGAKGITLYPFFSGAVGLTSQIIGLTLAHNRYDVLRAYMESICFEIKLMLDALAREGFKHDSLKVTGGASRSKIWMNILSNVLNKTVHVEFHPDAACIGAFKLAASGFIQVSADDFGHYIDLNEVADKEKNEGKYKPNKNEAEIYRKLYAKYIRNRANGNRERMSK